MIELGKTYKDCYGTDVRIICVDRGGYWSVVGLVDNDILRIYTAEGKLNKSDESPYRFIDRDSGKWWSLKIKHWMPLPNPPAQGEQE